MSIDREEEMTTLRNELIARANLMSGAEFSVKTRRLRQAGGWWPNSLDDWQTDQGRSLSAEIRAARA